MKMKMKMEMKMKIEMKIEVRISKLPSWKLFLSCRPRSLMILGGRGVVGSLRTVTDSHRIGDDVSV